MFKAKPCKFCHATTHSSFACFQRPAKPLRVGRRMRTVGKIGQKWLDTRREWIAKHPPDSNGYWYCYLKVSPFCRVIMTEETLTLDHIKSRTRHPELRFTESNLAPACGPCNEHKGSRDLTQL